LKDAPIPPWLIAVRGVVYRGRSPIDSTSLKIAIRGGSILGKNKGKQISTFTRRQVLYTKVHLDIHSK